MNNWQKLIPPAFTRPLIVAALFYCFTTPSEAQAGWTCDWLGFGCAAEVTRQVIDPKHPPEVFSFTLSGTFSKWADIPPETFICDTRKREDRACVWRGHIADIKRTIVFSLKPFPHDRSLYEVDGFMASALGEDPDFRSSVSIPKEYNGAPYLWGVSQLTLAAMVDHPLQVDIFEGGHYSQAKDKDVSVGHITATFKEILK